MKKIFILFLSFLMIFSLIIPSSFAELIDVSKNDSENISEENTPEQSLDSIDKTLNENSKEITEESETTVNQIENKSNVFKEEIVKEDNIRNDNGDPYDISGLEIYVGDEKIEYEKLEGEDNNTDFDVYKVVVPEGTKIISFKGLNVDNLVGTIYDKNTTKGFTNKQIAMYLTRKFTDEELMDRINDFGYSTIDEYVKGMNGNYPKPFPSSQPFDIFIENNDGVYDLDLSLDDNCTVYFECERKNYTSPCCPYRSGRFILFFCGYQLYCT